MRVPVGSTHPFETLEFLIVVSLIVVLVFVVLLLLLFRLRCILASATSLSATFGGLFSFHGSFLTLAPSASIGCIMSTNLLRSPMTPNVRNSLHFALFCQLFCLLFLLLQFEAFRRRFELLLVHHEEVTWSALRKVRLGQNVLNPRDWRNFALVINILQLVHLVRLVDDSITLLKVDQFVLLRTRCQLLTERGCCCLLLTTIII